MKIRWLAHKFRQEAHKFRQETDQEEDRRDCCEASLHGRKVPNI